MREKSEMHGFTHFDVDHETQGISSVVAPEIGLVHAGHDVHGARQPFLHGRRARSGGVGLLRRRRPAHARDADQHSEEAADRSGSRSKGARATGITPKDIMLHVIRQLGIAGAPPAPSNSPGR